MSSNLIIEKVKLLVRPIVEELDYELYHVEFVKESGNLYLRIYIDKENCKISLNDCEIVSRRISELLDAEDPIKDQYYLEVSSPGIYRNLYTDDHFNKVIGKEVLIKLASPINGVKSIKGILKAINDDIIIIKDNDIEINIPKEKIRNANLEGEI